MSGIEPQIPEALIPYIAQLKITAHVFAAHGHFPAVIDYESILGFGTV
jgi:hypothetical protein